MTRKSLIIIVLLTLFGAVLRWTHLSSQSLWFDEGYTAWAINHPPSEIIRLIRADTAPPLYYLLLHAWVFLFGRTETGLRGLSALAGTLQIPLVYLIAQRVFRPNSSSPCTQGEDRGGGSAQVVRENQITAPSAKPPPQPSPGVPGEGEKTCAAATAATLLFCLSFLQYQYSREARSYELLCLLTTLALFFLLRYLDHGRKIWLVPLSASLATALYIHNMMLAQLPALAIAALLIPSPQRIRDRLRDGGIVIGITAILYLPWVLNLAAQAHRVNQGFWLGRPTFTSLASDLAGLCGIIHLWTWDRYISHFHIHVVRDVPIGACAILTCGLILTLLRLHGNPLRIALALFSLALIPPLMTAAYSTIATPIFMMKLFLFSTIPICILIAGPIAWSRPIVTIPWIVLAIVLYAANDAAFIHEQENEDWRSVAGYVSNLPPLPSGHHRLLLFAASEGQLLFVYYYTPHPYEVDYGLPRGFFDIDPPQTLQRVLTDADLDPARRLLDSTHFDDIVLIYAHAFWADPNSRIIPFLTQRYPQSQKHEFHLIEVWQFAPR